MCSSAQKSIFGSPSYPPPLSIALAVRAKRARVASGAAALSVQIRVFASAATALDVPTLGAAQNKPRSLRWVCWFEVVSDNSDHCAELWVVSRRPR